MPELRGGAGVRVLRDHHQTQNDVVRTVQWEKVPEEANSYRVSFMMTVGGI